MIRRALIATAVLTVALVGWTILVAPALVDSIEALTGRGGDIEFILRIHFAYGTALLLAGLLFVLVALPPADRRLRWLTTALCLEAIVLIGIWLLDSKGFTREVSAVTFFSAWTILVAAALAAMNVPAARALSGSHPLAGTFWMLLAMAFLLAALDEYFTIHERIGFFFAPLTERLGLPEAFFQDGITVGYAVGGPLFVLIFFRAFRGELMRRGQMAGWLLLAGIVTYGVAVACDTLDFVGEALLPLNNPFHLMNFAEEAFELTAGVLFACAFAIALLERRPAAFDEMLGRPADAPRVRRIAGALIAIGAGVAILVPLIVYINAVDRTLMAEPAGDFDVTLFADASDGLDSVDELLFIPGIGLLAGNEGTGELLRFATDGSASVFAAGLASPDGLAYDGSHVYAADENRDIVQIYRGDGTPVGQITGVMGPEGVAVIPGGDVFVAERGRHLVLAANSTGRRIAASQLDGMVAPEQLALDADDNLFIADERLRSVFRLAADGTLTPFLNSDDGLGVPEAMVVHEGYLYISDSQRSLIHRFDLQGNGGVYLKFAKRYDLAGLTFDASGIMYQAITSDYRGHNRILRIAPR